MTELDLALKSKAEHMITSVDACMDELAFSKALQAIWEVIGAGNKYIDETAPWTPGKGSSQSGASGHGDVLPAGNPTHDSQPGGALHA